MAASSRDDDGAARMAVQCRVPRVEAIKEDIAANDDEVLLS